MKLVLGPANSAKAGEVLGACAAAAGHRAVLVVPTGQDVRRYARELAERGAVLGSSVVTFSALMRELGRRAGYGPPRLTHAQRERVLRRVIAELRFTVSARSARSPGFANAAWRLISELERSLVAPERFAAALDSWAARDRRRRGYAEDLATLYGGYVRELRRLGRVDDERFAWGALEALAALPRSWEAAPVFVYGFDDLTPLERLALETLSGTAGAEVVVSLTWERGRAALKARGETLEALQRVAGSVVELPPLADYYRPEAAAVLHHLERRLFETDAGERIDPGSAVRLLESGGERAEVELIASEVLALLRAGVPPGEIVVVYRSLRWAGQLLERVFTAAGIPISTRRAVPFAHTALGRGLTALVRCALLGEHLPGVDELLAYLRTPGVLAEPEVADRVEAMVRRKGIRDAAQALKRSELRLAEIALLRDARDPLDELARQARALLSSHRRGLAPVLEQREELDARALSVLLRTLEELRELDGPVRGQELVEVLEGLTVPVESGSSEGAVLIAEPLEIRAQRFRVVFVGGLQESEFPRLGGPDPLLSDELRRELAAPSSANCNGASLDPAGAGGPVRLRLRADALEHERYLFYATVTRATEQVVLSYRSSDEEGGIELPSPFIADVADLLDSGWMARRRRRLLADVVWPLAEAPTAREAARARALAAAAAHTAAATSGSYELPALGEAALGHVRHHRIVSAGALECYADCPVKWLVERELRPEPLAPEADYFIRGRVVHTVLELLYRRLGAPLSEASLGGARKIVGELLAEHAGAVGAGQPPAIRAGLVRSIEADIGRFLECEASSAGTWPPEMLELRFGFEDEQEDDEEQEEDGSDAPGEPKPSLPAFELPGGTRVRGMIDRVDVEPAHRGAAGGRRAIVRDYKTGGTRSEFQGSHWEPDRQLQVPLYMLAVKQLLGLEPVAGFYQPLGGDDLRPRGVFTEGAPVGEGVLATDERGPEELSAVLEGTAARAAELAAGLRAGRIPPQPDTCSRYGCAYPGICRAG